MSTTTAPPVAATPAGPVRQRVRGMVRSWAPWWAILVVGALWGQVPWGRELVVAYGVLLVVAAAAALVGRRLRRRQDLPYGGPGQRDFFERALTGDRVHPDGDVGAWRLPLPVLRRRAEEAVLGMRWTWVAVLLSSVLVVLAGAAGYRAVAVSLSAVAVLTVVAWPFLAVHLRRRRDRLDALAERLGRG